MLMQRRYLLIALSAIAVFGSAYSARATTVEFFATPLGKDEASVRITMTEDDGNIVVSLFADEGVTDLRWVSLDIIDESKLKGLTVIGEDVKRFKIHAHGDRDHPSKKSDDKGDKHDKKHGGKHHDSKWRRDIAIALGTSCSKDDLVETTFVLDAKADLAITDFTGEKISLRVSGLKDGKCDNGKCDDDHGRGSFRLVATVPIPEPTAAALLAFGLGALGYAARSRR